MLSIPMACKKIDINEVPSHKRISSTTYLVDFFSATVDGSTHHFLSHFHSDHYYGLKRSFKHPVICSATTAELVRTKIGAECIPLEMSKTYEIGTDSYVQCIEAHHCPGAVCFLFRIRDEFFLHTGDFKAMECFYRPEIDLKYRKIYLDNTYEGFRGFMSQAEAIHAVIRAMEERMGKCCLAEVMYDWYFCTYLVGKEKLFLSAAEYFNMNVKVDSGKMNIYNCFSEYTKSLLNESVIEAVNKYQGETKILRDFGFTRKGDECKSVSSEKSIIPSTGSNMDLSIVSPKCPPTPICTVEEMDRRMPFDRISTGNSGSCIHIISPMHLTKSRLNKTFENSRADRIVVFFGTGWRESSVFHNWTRGDGKIIRKGIEIVYVPYSEHSSATELKTFKERMRCDEFVNTVNQR